MTTDLPGKTVTRAERLAVSALVLLGGVVILRDAASLSAQSSYFPLFVGVALMVLSVISSVASWRHGDKPTDEAGLTMGIGGLLLLGLFIFSAARIGFLTSTLWFLPALAVLGGERHWVRLVIITAIFSALVYAIFTLIFAQSLPPELIERAF